MQQGIMEEMKACDKRKGNVYHTLKKIQAGMFRIGFNLWDIFRELDPDRHEIIPEIKFLSVLNGPLRQLIGLTEEEVLCTSSIFKKEDGNVDYGQFCHMIHDYRPPPTTKEELEQEDPYRYNDNLTKREEKILNDTLNYIACTVTKKKLLLRPFFQDYELIKKRMGLITKTTFFKVLHFMGVRFHKQVLDILVKRYMKDNYTIKYNAFIKELDEVFHYLESNNYTDNSGQLWDSSKIPLYEKPAAEGAEAGLQQVFLPTWKYKSKIDPREFVNLLSKIRQHICRNKIRVRDYFMVYDPKLTLRVDGSDFFMGLRWLAFGRLDTINLYITNREISMLSDLYADSINYHRKLWKVFEYDIEGDLNPEELEKWPETPLDIPSQKLEDRYPRPKTPPGKKVETITDMMYGFKLRQEKHNADFLSAFLLIDERNCGFLNTDRFHEALGTIPVFLTDQEFEWICQQYMQEDGLIHWQSFIQDLNRTQSTIKDAKETMEQQKKKEMEHKIQMELEKRECNIVEILAKIKNAMRCYRARIIDYISPFDKENTGLVTIENFKKALAVHDLKLTERELDTIFYVFCLPNNENFVEYTKFTNVVDEKSIRPCLTRPPLKEAMKMEEEEIVKPLLEYQFLNFEERQIASLALKKLSRLVTMGYLDYFKSLDKDGTGTICRYIFMTALFKINVLHMISMREMDVIFKCFGLICKNGDMEINYIGFLNALDIVFKNQKTAESV